MKITQGALTLFTLPCLAQAGSDGKPRGKISVQHASSRKKRFVSRSHLKGNPAVSKALARSAAVSAHATTAKVGAEAADAPAPTAECVVIGNWCIPGPPHNDPEGAVCGNDGQPDEAYCNYSFGPNACVIGCQSTSISPEAADAPMIDGYTFRGVGCCQNDEGKIYDWNTVGSGATVEECAAACQESYSSDEFFVGVNFNSDWYGSSNCDCMTDPGGNGNITSAGAVGWCAEELCYSYNEANPPIVQRPFKLQKEEPVEPVIA